MQSPLDDIKNKDFARIYLLCGPESFLRITQMRQLANACVPQTDGMNRAEMSGEHVSEQEIIDFAESLPFFGERRLIVVKDSGFFQKSCELLPDYVPQIPAHSTILFCETKADGRNRLYQAVKKYGRIFSYDRPDPRKDKSGYASAMQMRKHWAARMLLDAGFKITEKDMDYLLSRTGSDMSTIRLETDKLINGCAGKEVISRADIETHTVTQAEDRIFEMVEAIARGEKRTAMELYADLLSLNTSATGILYHLGRQYRLLYTIRACRDEGLSQDAIASQMNIHPYRVKKMLPIAMKETQETLRQKLSSIASAETDIKSGRLSDRLACEMEILSLMPRSD